MKINKLGEIIANRRFRVGDSEPLMEVVVQIGKPVPFPESTDYFTPYQIQKFGIGRIKYAGGIDAIQSLQLAMKMIGFELADINISLEERLIWEGDENGDLGFPTSEY